MKKLCLYGFTTNAAVMLMPALRYVFGELSFVIEENRDRNHYLDRVEIYNRLSTSQCRNYTKNET